MRVLPVFLFLLGAPPSALAQGKPEHPARSGPQFATIYRVDVEKRFLDCRFVNAEPAPGPVFGKYTYKAHLRRDFERDIKAYDAQGEQLTEKQYWDRLKEGTLVLVFWNELDPYYLRILHRDGMALVLPSVSAVLGPIPE